MEGVKDIFTNVDGGKKKSGFFLVMLLRHHINGSESKYVVWSFTLAFLHLVYSLELWDSLVIVGFRLSVTRKRKRVN